MTHRTTHRFWRLHDQLPEAIQALAKKKHELLKSDPHHPSLHFKKVDTELWPARIGRRYRALATMEDGNYVWFWIGEFGYRIWDIRYRRIPDIGNWNSDSVLCPLSSVLCSLTPDS